MIRHNFNPHSRSAPEPENFDSELNGPIKQKEDKPNKKASLLEIANNSISSGLGQFNQSLASTLDFLLPTEFLGKYDFVSKINDYYSNQADRFSNKLQESVSDRGKPIQIGAKALEATTSAAPNALLAVMSGGTSAAAQGTTAALSTASAAAGRSAVANAVRQTAANPLYWSSVVQTLGNNYEHAKAKGANELQATGSAITSSLLNAAAETGGGVETLPGILKSRARGPASAWAKSALTEGLEEPIQGVVSGASEALLFDRDKPVASLSDRNAIFSPSRMAEEFAMGTTVGGILGAGQLAGSRLFTPDPMEPARRGDYSGLIQQLDQAIHRKRLKELETAYKKNVGQGTQPQAKESEAAEVREFNNQSDYSQWLASIGAQGSELDTLEKYSAAKYNNSTEYAMLERYATDVETGWISPLSGFENYQTLNRKIETEIVGATTANGLAINGFVPHFMQRVIGTTVDPKILEENLQIVRRSGVDVDEIKNAVFSPEKIGDITVRKTGHKSIKLIGRNCVVTINPDTGELIQTNPLGG